LHFSHVRDQTTFGYLIQTFGAHRVQSSKTTLAMPPRRVSQHLNADEGLLQTSDQNQSPLEQPSSQILPTITEVAEPTFHNIPEVQLQQATMPTIAANSQSKQRRRPAPVTPYFSKKNSVL
jgi:hypothetical protein